MKVPAKSNGRHKWGEPTIRTDENAAIICETIGNGGTVADAARAIGCQPVSIRVWEHDDAAFKTLVTRAKEFWSDAAADKCAQTATEPPRMIVAEDGTERVDSGWVQHITSQLNYFKWLMSKRDPKRYGDRLEVEVNDTTPRESLSELRARVQALKFQHSRD